ncbi:hypothetical protein [Rubritalea sp.]|uniref:hypothetical protein n=1 Tax=Rubritalea sp. TaxID=2109375 RepID=UPI003EF120CB
MRIITTFLITNLVTYALPVFAGIPLGETVGIDFDSSNHGGKSPAKSLIFNHFDDGKGIINGDTLSYSKPLITTESKQLTGVGFSLTNNTGQVTNRVNEQEGYGGSGVFSEPSIYADRILSNDTASMKLDENAHFLLTFSGLDDDLSYNLSGGYDCANDNFDSIWSAGDQSFKSLAGSGYGTLTGLRTDGRGTLVIRVKRNTKHVTIGGLTLTATVTPFLSDKHSALMHFGSTSLLLNQSQ